MNGLSDHDLRRAAEGMEGREALPTGATGEPAFQQPWQGRMVAVAIEVVAELGVSWEEFRGRLIEAIDRDPERAYYDSWLVALEGLVAAHGLATPDQLEAERFVAASYRVSEQAPDDLEVFPIGVDETTLHDVLSELFGRWWQSIRFGTLIHGAVYELCAEQEPRLGMLDGYLTVEWGSSHLHLCIGEQRGDHGRPVDPLLARRRRCAHAELQRLWVDAAPRSWMFRMYNGDGDQQLTVLLPNPFLSDAQAALPRPDWSRLEAWDRLRRRHLGLPPDPSDRIGTEFVHG